MLQRDSGATFFAVVLVLLSAAALVIFGAQMAIYLVLLAIFVVLVNWPQMPHRG